MFANFEIAIVFKFVGMCDFNAGLGICSLSALKLLLLKVEIKGAVFTNINDLANLGLSGAIMLLEVELEFPGGVGRSPLFRTNAIIVIERVEMLAVLVQILLLVSLHVVLQVGTQDLTVLHVSDRHSIVLVIVLLEGDDQVTGLDTPDADLSVVADRTQKRLFY